MKGPVICAIEDPSSTGAVKVASELARSHDLPLLYVHVINGKVDEPSIEVRRIEAPAHGDFLVAHSHHPTDCLLEIARERQASFLVVGNHGPRSSLLGSVSAEVARRSPCPVVVVPPTADLQEERVDGSVIDMAGGIVRLRTNDGALRRAA